MKISILLLIPVLFLGACKKEKVASGTDETVPDKVISVTDSIPANNGATVNLPDGVMVVGNNDINTSKNNLYLLDAATGQLVTRYSYKSDGHSNFSKPIVANGLLYNVQRDKIDAITLNTGTILWTDSIGMNTDGISIILHDNTFYGVCYKHDGTSGGDFIYALDAAKKSSSYLWKTQLIIDGNRGDLPVRYRNGIVYVLHGDGFSLNALDAKTGLLKWAISNKNSKYSLASLDNGVIIAGHAVIDAASGSQTATVNDPVIAPVAAGATQIASSLDYVSADRYFVETTQATGGLTQQSFLSAIDRTTGAEKWRSDFGNITGDTQGNTKTTKAIKLVWNNKLIVEKTVLTVTAPADKFGNLTFKDFTNGLSTLDITTGMDKAAAGGESNFTAGLVENDHNGNFIANNMIYGNYNPTNKTITVYATDLLTGQQKWLSKLLPGDGFGVIYTCVYFKTEGKTYSRAVDL